VINPKISPLQVLAQLGNHAGKDQILRQWVEPGHVDDLHAAVFKPAPGQVIGDSIIGDQALGTGADVAKPVAHLSDGGNVMRLPDLAPLSQPFHIVKDPPEEVLEVGKRLDRKGPGPEGLIQVFTPDHSLSKKIDEGVGLGIDVVPIEDHLGIVQHFTEPPDQGLGIGSQRLVSAQRVEIDAVRLERSVVLHVLEGFWGEAEAGVLAKVFSAQVGRLVEKTEVGAFYIEADRGHSPPMRGEALKNAAQQKLDRTGLGREPGHPGDIEMGGLGTQKKIAVEIYRCFQASSSVESDWNSSGLRVGRVTVHPKRKEHIRVGRHPDRAQGNGLERLLRNLPEYRGRVQADLGQLGRCSWTSGITPGPQSGLERRGPIGVRNAVSDHPVDGPTVLLHPDYGSDAYRRVLRGPEMELVGCRGLKLGRDHPPDRERLRIHAKIWGRRTPYRKVMFKEMYERASMIRISHGRQAARATLTMGAARGLEWITTFLVQGQTGPSRLSFLPLNWLISSARSIICAVAIALWSTLCVALFRSCASSEATCRISTR
jgi:hypothetical protein